MTDQNWKLALDIMNAAFAWLKRREAIHLVIRVQFSSQCCDGMGVH